MAFGLRAVLSGAVRSLDGPFADAASLPHQLRGGVGTPGNGSERQVHQRSQRRQELARGYARDCARDGRDRVHLRFPSAAQPSDPDRDHRQRARRRFTGEPRSAAQVHRAPQGQGVPGVGRSAQPRVRQGGVSQGPDGPVEAGRGAVSESHRSGQKTRRETPAPPGHANPTGRFAPGPSPDAVPAMRLPATTGCSASSKG